MESRTILFFQQLYENSVSQEKILEFCRKNELEELEKTAFFARQLLISPKARELGANYQNLKKEMSEISEPVEALPILEQFTSMKNQASKSMLDTMKTLDKDFFLPEEISILSPVMDKFALDKIRKMMSVTLYAAINQQGIVCRDFLKQQRAMNAVDLNNIFSVMRLWKIIYRTLLSGEVMAWRYTQRFIECGSLGIVPQYFSVDAWKNNGAIVIGKPVISYGEKEYGQDAKKTVMGEGRITNLNPSQEDIFELLTSSVKIYTEKDLTLKNISIWDLNFDDSPDEILNNIFSGMPFVVSPEEYFQFANISLFFQRTRRVFGD